MCAAFKVEKLILSTHETLQVEATVQSFLSRTQGPYDAYHPSDVYSQRMMPILPGKEPSASWNLGHCTDEIQGRMGMFVTHRDV